MNITDATSSNFGFNLLNESIALREEMVDRAKPEQQALLRYASVKELFDIRACYNHPRQKELVAMIKSGHWQELVKYNQNEKSYNKNFNIYSIIKAAYCQGALDNIEDLATAYMFLAPQENGENYAIHSLEEVRDLVGSSFISAHWPDIDQIPENQRYFISIEKESLDSGTKKEMETIFDPTRYVDGPAGGIKYTANEKCYYFLGSASLLKSDIRAKGLPPVFIRGLTPSREKLIENMTNGLSDYALIDPFYDEFENIHNGHNRGCFPYFHDSYHLAARVGTNIIKYKNVLNLALKIENLLKTEFPKYSPGCIINGEFTPKILDDLSRHLMERTLDRIGDGLPLECAVEQDSKNPTGIMQYQFNVAAMSHKRFHDVFKKFQNPLICLLNERLKSLQIGLEPGEYSWCNQRCSL